MPFARRKNLEKLSFSKKERKALKFQSAQVLQLIYIYKRLRPNKKNPQQKKRKSRKSNFLHEIEHPTS